MTCTATGTAVPGQYENHSDGHGHDTRRHRGHRPGHLALLRGATGDRRRKVDQPRGRRRADRPADPGRGPRRLALHGDQHRQRAAGLVARSTTRSARQHAPGSARSLPATPSPVAPPVSAEPGQYENVATVTGTFRGCRRRSPTRTRRTTSGCNAGSTSRRPPTARTPTCPPARRSGRRPDHLDLRGHQHQQRARHRRPGRRRPARRDHDCPHDTRRG